MRVCRHKGGAFRNGLSAVPEHDAIHTDLETVGEQIHWSRARRIVLPKLQKHLEDQRDAFAAEGHCFRRQLQYVETKGPCAQRRGLLRHIWISG
jgi:hypothetical protein